MPPSLYRSGSPPALYSRISSSAASCSVSHRANLKVPDASRALSSHLSFRVAHSHLVSGLGLLSLAGSEEIQLVARPWSPRSIHCTAGLTPTWASHQCASYHVMEDTYSDLLRHGHGWGCLLFHSKPPDLLVMLSLVICSRQLCGLAPL